MRDGPRLAALVRRVLLAPAIVGGAGLCLLVVLVAAGVPAAKDLNPLGNNDATAAGHFEHTISSDVEGTPNAADVRRAQVPPPERKRRLLAHPYYALYKAAKRRYEVSWFLVASIHYQETGFRRARASRKHKRTRKERTRVRAKDFNAVMRIAAQLRHKGARGLGPSAVRATTARYGKGANGKLSAAMVLERARAWKLLGVIPQPGSGELATPAKGTIGGCGYFHCPRPGHLHNGVDFLAPMGTPVHAADAGRVALIETPDRSGGYGNFVCIQHRPHLATCYAHVSAFAPRLHVGHSVRRGQVLGLVGSTGSSTAPHLHFELRRGWASCQACAVDPMPLLDGKVPQDSVPELAKLRRQSKTNAAAAPGSAPRSGGAAGYVPPAPVVPAAPAAPATPEPEPQPEPKPDAEPTPLDQYEATPPPAAPPVSDEGGAVAP